MTIKIKTYHILISLFALLFLNFSHVRSSFHYRYLEGSPVEARELKDVSIDVVFTWVDMDDPKWRKLYNQWSNTTKFAEDIQFKDWGTLKFAILSVYLYAPWVNHIYIVTMQQQPSWTKEAEWQFLLNRVTFVYHEDLMPREILPTFNSATIELFLHLIPGLSEYYLYLNDDMIFGNFVEPTHFFTNEGNPKIFLEQKCMNPEDIVQKWEDLLNELSINRECRKRSLHAPRARRKSFEIKRFQSYPEIYEQARLLRFRTPDMLHDMYYFAGYWMLYTQRAVEGGISNVYATLKLSYRQNEILFERLMRDRPKTFVLQDKIYFDRDTWMDPEFFFYGSPTKQNIADQVENNLKKYFLTEKR